MRNKPRTQSVGRLRRKRPYRAPRAAATPVVDTARLAHVLFGPVHALVAMLAHNRTAYAIRHACTLEKRAVDAAATALVAAGVLHLDGPIYSRVDIAPARVVAAFGAKYAAKLMVWPQLATHVPYRRRRRAPASSRRA